MKTFILCGGLGTRLDHEGTLMAKPMVKIGSKPILIHIINSYIDQSFNEFVFCLGHKSESIKDFFLITNRDKITLLEKNRKYTKFKYSYGNKKFVGYLIYTGLRTGTGGRIKIAYNKMKLNEDILMTYGDGLANINIKKLIKFHYKKKSIVTLTAARPKHRYGIIKIKKDKIEKFDNENKSIDVFINGGFFVIDKSAINKIKNNNTFWEKEPLNYFIKKRKLFAFKHSGFWKSLDTLKDKNDFDIMIKKGKTPWKVKKN